jgi:hypothetical protein
MINLLQLGNTGMKYLISMLLVTAALVFPVLVPAQTNTFANMVSPPTGVIEDINHDAKLLVIHDDLYSLANGLVVYASPDRLLQIDPATLAVGASIAYVYKGKGSRRTIQQIWLLPQGISEKSSTTD